MWLDEDQDKVAAWLRHKREICPRCGTVEADWIDAHTGKYRDDPKWQATTFRCPGCAEVERVSADIPPTGAHGVRVVLMPATDDDDEGREEPRLTAQ